MCYIYTCIRVCASCLCVSVMCILHINFLLTQFAKIPQVSYQNSDTKYHTITTFLKNQRAYNQNVSRDGVQGPPPLAPPPTRTRTLAHMHTRTHSALCIYIYIHTCIYMCQELSTAHPSNILINSPHTSHLFAVPLPYAKFCCVARLIVLFHLTSKNFVCLPSSPQSEDLVLIV